MLIDKARLHKCDARLVRLLEKSTNPDQFFSIEVIMREAVTNYERQRLRQLLIVRSIWARVAMGTAKITGIYGINSLDFVEKVAISGHLDVGSYYRVVGNYTPHFENPRGWLERLRDTFSRWLKWLKG